MAFFITLKKRYYYTFFLILFTLAFIELNNGFKVFSLAILATFVYVFLVPNINRVFSFSFLNSYIYMTVFYIGGLIIWLIDNEFSSLLISILSINLLIDFLIFGFFI